LYPFSQTEQTGKKYQVPRIPRDEPNLKCYQKVPEVELESRRQKNGRRTSARKGRNREKAMEEEAGRPLVKTTSSASILEGNPRGSQGGHGGEPDSNHKSAQKQTEQDLRSHGSTRWGGGRAGSQNVQWLKPPAAGAAGSGSPQQREIPAEEVDGRGRARQCREFFKRAHFKKKTGDKRALF
jgi:hypothetical protein